MAQRKLTLLRHGQCGQGDDDPCLTELGQKQAELTGQVLCDFDITAIHYSTLVRARETADIIAQNFPGVPITGHDLLWEGVPPVPPVFLDYFGQQPDVDLSDTPITKKRFDAAYYHFFKPAKESNVHDLIICHGNIIRYLITRALKIDPHTWVFLTVDNCSLSQIIIGPDNAPSMSHFGDTVNILRFCNETGHLPADLRSQN